MLCIVCSRPIPIPIYHDENKLCKSCASEIKLKDDLMKNYCTDADLEIVQRQLLHDLNLDDDSDYEAELNYLKEAKRTAQLGKEKNLQSFHPNESLKEFSENQFTKLKAKTETSTKQFVPEIPNEMKLLDDREHFPKSFADFKFITHEQKLPQSCECGQSKKEKIHKRLHINRDIKHSIVSLIKPEENSNQSGDETFAYRAVFRPNEIHREPHPQFERINAVEKREIIKAEVLPTTGNKNPFICPVTFCKNIIPVSDLIKHFKLNHIRVPIVPVNCGTCTNLFWESKMDRFGTTQCLMLLLMTTKKCRQIVSGNFKDYLPVAIMTTKVKFSDLMDGECNEDDDRHFYLIWLTVMSSSVEPVYYTVTAWNGTDDGRVHVVNTTQTYSIRADQNPKIVYQSGMVMMLTSEQIDRLSNSNQDMIKLQVVVH